MTTSQNTTSTDPFSNLGALRLSQNFTTGVKKLLTHVPVRKPGRQDFVRVHPAEEYRMPCAALVELKDDREIFFVLPDVAAEVPQEYFAAALYLATTRQNTLFIWPVRLPSPDGRVSTWHQSAAEAAERAMKVWVRMSANMSLGSYDIFEATGNLTEPEWPALSMSEIMKIAFKGQLIDTVDHPVLKKLRGE